MGKQKAIYGYLAFILLILGVFLPGLNGSYLLDDFSNLVTNMAVQLNFSDEHFWSKAWFSGISNNSEAYRPLSMVFFAVEHAVFGDFSPWRMKLINVVIHLINGILVACLTHSFILRYFSKSYFKYLPLFVFVVWALSPINIGNVLYIVQRMNLLSSFTALLGLNIYFFARWNLRSKPILWTVCLVALLISWVGQGFKANSILAIFFILAYELTDQDGFLRKFILAPNRYFNLIAVVSIVAFVVYSWGLVQYYLTGYEERVFTWQERALIQPQILAVYLSYSFLPVPDLARFYHDGLSLFSWQPLQTFWLILFSVIILWAAYRMLYRKDVLCLFTVGWFFIFHLMESTFLALEPAYNHRNYLPLFGPVLGFSYYLFKLVQSDHHKLRYFKVFVGVYLIALLLSSILQSLVWGNKIVFLETEAEKYPLSPRALFAAGFANLVSAQPNACSLSKIRFEKTVERSDEAYLGGLYGLWEHSEICGEEYKEQYWEELEYRLRNASLHASSFLYLTEMLSSCHDKQTGCARLSQIIWNLNNRPNLSLSDKQDIYMLQYVAAKESHDLVSMERVLRQGLQDIPNSFPLNLGLLQLLFDLNKCEEYKSQTDRIMLTSNLNKRVAMSSKVWGQECDKRHLTDE